MSWGVGPFLRVMASVHGVSVNGKRIVVITPPRNHGHPLLAVPSTVTTAVAAVGIQQERASTPDDPHSAPEGPEAPSGDPGGHAARTTSAPCRRTTAADRRASSSAPPSSRDGDARTAMEPAGPHGKQNGTGPLPSDHPPPRGWPPPPSPPGSRTPRTPGSPQRAECPVAIRAVPAPDPHPRGLHPGIGAVTAQAASRHASLRTRRRGCFPPTLADNILLSDQSRFMSELNGPSTAHGPATVIARASFFCCRFRPPASMPSAMRQSNETSHAPRTGRDSLRILLPETAT